MPEGMAGMLDQAGPMLRRMHGSMFALQLGQGVGSLAGEVLTGCEVSLPLVAAPDVVLMPAAVRELAEGLEVDEPQARLYLAVREVARVRLFEGVPWLAAGLLAAVRDYAGDITIDTEGIEEAVRSIDPSDPRGRPAGPPGKAVRPAALPEPGRRTRSARDAAGPRRGLGRRRHRACGLRAPARGRRPRRGGPATPGHRRPGREGLRGPRRPRAATPPAARRREPLPRPRGLRWRDGPRRGLAPPRPRPVGRRPRRPARLRRAHRRAGHRRPRRRARRAAARRGRAVSRAAEVARSFAHLHADAARVLGGWSAPDAGQEAAAPLATSPSSPRTPRAWPRPDPPSTSPPRASSSTPRGEQGPAHPPPPGSRVVPVRRPPRGRRRLAVGGGAARGARGVRPRCARAPARPRPARPARPRRRLRVVPRAPRRPLRGARPRGHRAAGQRRVARRALVAGRRACPRAPGPSSHPWSPSPVAPSGSSDGGSPVAWASPSRKPRARSRRG